MRKEMGIAMASSPPTPNFENLSTAEKILQLQDAWDRIADNPESVELTPAQKAVLDARLESLAASPDKGTSWEEIKRSLQK
jgi:putative addiction module component (TIGR02574 family)